MSDFGYLNRSYGLNLKRGTRFEYTGDPAKGAQQGVVVSADGAHVRLRFDSQTKVVGPFHPTWELRYLEAEPSNG